MAQAPAMIPEGERLPNIYPVEFWTEQEERTVKKPVDIEVEVFTKDEFGNEIKKKEMRQVLRDEVQYVNEEYVKWQKKGDNKTAVVVKIRLMKKLDPIAWRVIEPFYKAWLKGEEIPESGTPLENWPLIRNKQQVAALKIIGIRTVEDLSTMPDAMLENIGTGARTLRDRAKAYVQAKGNEAQFAVMLTERDEKLEKQAAQIEELQKNLDTLSRNMPEKKKPSDVAKSKGE